MCLLREEEEEGMMMMMREEKQILKYSFSIQFLPILAILPLPIEKCRKGIRIKNINMD
jgi:hypothetical protein